MSNATCPHITATDSQTTADDGAKPVEHIEETLKPISDLYISSLEEGRSSGIHRSLSGTGNSSLISRPSTERYQCFQHVPFAQFKSQVEELCLSLWKTHDESSDGSHSVENTARGRSRSSRPTTAAIVTEVRPTFHRAFARRCL